MKLWSYLRQILSGFVTYIALMLTIDFGLFVFIPLLARPIFDRNILDSLSSLFCFAALAALSYFLYRKLCHGVRLAWWTANICSSLMLLFTIHAFWFAYHFRGDFERTDGGFSFFLAQLLGCMTLLGFVVINLPATRRYSGISRG